MIISFHKKDEDKRIHSWKEVMLKLKQLKKDDCENGMNILYFGNYIDIQRREG